MTIELFSIEYDANNSQNTFTNGDTITGRIILQVSKKTRIQSLIFRAKGKANVCWHEHYGQYTHVVITSNEKYYDIERPIFTEVGRDGKVFHLFMLLCENMSICYILTSFLNCYIYDPCNI